MPETREDAEQLPELPPLGEGEETEPDGDFSDLLRSFEGDAGLDDTEAEELDAGVDIEEDAEGVSDDADSPIDVGEVVEASGEEDLPSSDENGPLGEGGSLFDDMTFQDFDADDAEGTVEPEDLIDEELPVLAEETDEQEGALGEEADQLLGMDEEEPPPRAERPWLEVPTRTVQECAVVCATKGLVAAGGTGVMFLGPDGDLRTASETLGDTVVGLLLDADAHSTLVITADGRMFRVGANPTPEEITTFRAELPAEADKHLSLSFGGPTPSGRPAALLRASTAGGVLLESTDRGVTWRKVELGGRVLAVSRGTPPVCLVETSGNAHLFRSEPSGAFRRLETELAFSDHVVLDSDGDVVAMLDPGAGVYVSADGGATFRQAAGCSRATAVTAGRLGGRPSAFAALYDVASGHTSIVWIDASSADAYIVAELLADGDAEGGADEATKVVSLAWEGEDETLWTAGAFGVRRFRRPPSA